MDKLEKFLHENNLNRYYGKMAKDIEKVNDKIDKPDFKQLSFDRQEINAIFSRQLSFFLNNNIGEMTLVLDKYSYTREVCETMKKSCNKMFKPIGESLKLDISFFLAYDYDNSMKKKHEVFVIGFTITKEVE